MRNANDCRAKDPRTCYYHGAIIEMNEAMERITSAGVNVKPADWDGYFNARQKVETAEDDLKKQQWMEEAQVLSAPKESPRGGSYRRSQPPQKGKQGARPVPAEKRKEQGVRRQPIVETPVSYNSNVFPPQIKWKDEHNKPAIFTRHDKTSELPVGLMLASSRELTQDEKTQLVNFVKYQHTISTRTEEGLKTIKENDVVFNHTGRSVYVKTQFDDAEQLKGFHASLAQMIESGTVPRKDGTQKYAAFGDESAKFALYYNN